MYINQETKICVECESKYIINSSKMTELCPNCAHELYGYPNCKHEFKDRKCIKCGWNGKRSEFLKSSK